MLPLLLLSRRLGQGYLFLSTLLCSRSFTMKGTGVSLTAEHIHSEKTLSCLWFLVFFQKKKSPLFDVSPSLCNDEMSVLYSHPHPSPPFPPPPLTCPVVLTLGDWCCAICVFTCMAVIYVLHLSFQCYMVLQNGVHKII